MVRWQGMLYMTPEMYIGQQICELGNVKGESGM